MTDTPVDLDVQPVAGAPNFKRRRRNLWIFTLGIGFLLIVAGLLMNGGAETLARPVTASEGADEAAEITAALKVMGDALAVAGMALMLLFTALNVTPSVRRWLGYKAQLDERDYHVTAGAVSMMNDYVYAALMATAIIDSYLGQSVAAYTCAAVVFVMVVGQQVCAAYLYRRH